MPPRATYRVQFSKAFGFDDAARLAPYLARLGVSHLYASPILKARPGSTHGYDTVDHGAVNPELGDRAAFGRLVAALREHGLKQILDVVPNHMGVGGADNPVWLDVLEWGPDSPKAGWFDIDWSPDRADLTDKLLVPVLGDQLGAELEAGRFELRFDAEAGSFAVWVYDTHKLPVSPRHYGTVIGTRHPALARLADAFADLDAWRPSERERAGELKAELSTLVADDPAARAALDAAVAGFRGEAGQPESWAKLAHLIAPQHWRPAFFRVAADDINYRRFFNIAELAGLRMELTSVFDHAHRLVFALMAEGVLDGLRIDHIDGLVDPLGYLRQLRSSAPWADPEHPFSLVVEKILAEGEPLPAAWPVDGTTGYDATNQLIQLLVDPAGEDAFSRTYAAFTGSVQSYGDLLRDCKLGIMDNEMASELAGLARAASRVAAETARSADFTRNILRRAIREIVAAFPVYRTYLDFDGVATTEDRTVIAAAIGAAEARDRAIDGSVYRFLEGLMTGDSAADPNSGFGRSAVLRFATKLQQYSGPVMAKGLEDTAFYRFNRFIALNEVGGDPLRFGLPVAAFHAAAAERAARWPHAMLSTSTHDTKRGEDARARLAALSEMPDAWRDAVAEWSGQLRRGTAPDRSDEYALYQTLIGAMPPALLAAGDGDPGWADYAERVQGAMRKAMREGKLHTSWASPDETYEAAMADLVDRALTGDAGAAFRRSFTPFAETVARLGVDNSLVQTALKLTLPGVPDIYRGAEAWELSMVDPDNRRPVDAAALAGQLSAIEAARADDPAAAFVRWRADWQDGSVKLALTTALLTLRRDDPELFDRGSYEPQRAEGEDGDSVVAFVRRHGERCLAVVVARFPARRAERGFDPGTRVPLPAAVTIWRDHLTDRPVTDGAIGPLLSILPVAVLVGTASDDGRAPGALQ